jgi:hypothetical protein
MKFFSGKTCKIEKKVYSLYMNFSDAFQLLSGYIKMRHQKEFIMRYIKTNHISKTSKNCYTMIVTYRNNPNTEYFYHKYFNDPYYADQWVQRRMLNPKVKYVTYQKGHLKHN